MRNKKQIESNYYKATKNLFNLERYSKNAKFRNLSEKELSRSKLFKLEKKNIKFKKYPRGTLILVNFGINHGSEFCFTHFAIVLNKDDNPKSDKLTVVPLTSKKGKDNLCIDKAVFESIFGKLQSDINGLVNFYYSSLKLLEESAKLDNDAIFRPQGQYNDLWIEFCERHDPEGKYIPLRIGDALRWIHKDLDLIKNLNEHYERFNKTSYAKLDNITTTSKYKVALPINDLDPVGSYTIPEKYLELLDQAIIKKLVSNSYKIQ